MGTQYELNVAEGKEYSSFKERVTLSRDKREVREGRGGQNHLRSDTPPAPGAGRRTICEARF